MKILVLNSGSSTVKFQVIETTDASGESRRQQKLARGLVDRIGAAASYRFEAQGTTANSDFVAIGDHEQAVRLIIDWLRANGHAGGFDAVGHRVVHGGAEFTSPARIDDKVLARIEALSDVAPLHNPAALSGIRAARKILGDSLPMAAAFDTSFHRTIPDEAGLYAIPYELSAKHGIRRYGFHGLAHQFSLLRYGELAGVSPDKASIVTLHLGNGCSATAIRRGESIDTSMGFTPLEGLVMGTRSGDIDPALVDYLAQKEGVSAAEIESWLNKRSGLLGLSGLSQDMRELTAAYESNSRARLAVDVFCHRARKYLGAYLALVGGAEAVVFSGGIGENSPLVREKICAGMEWCGLNLDARLNATAPAHDWRIAAEDAKIIAYVVHTDEEGIIARETARLCVM
ncbi:MAG TPA: acetate kinase [Candidatus Binatia bacterium]